MPRHPAGFGSRLSAPVAGLTLGVVVGQLCVECYMRVVAGQATDARIVGIVASAAPKPVWLKANVTDVVVFVNHDI